MLLCCVEINAEILTKIVFSNEANFNNREEALISAL